MGKNHEKPFLAYPARISVNPDGVENVVLHGGCKTTPVHGVRMNGTFLYQNEGVLA